MLRAENLGIHRTVTGQECCTIVLESVHWISLCLYIKIKSSYKLTHIGGKNTFFFTSVIK